MLKMDQVADVLPRICATKMRESVLLEESTMKRSSFTEEQMIFAVKQL